MIRKITTTKERIPDILRSLSLVKIAGDVALIEQIHKDFLHVPDVEEAEDNTFKIHEIMQQVIKMDREGLDFLLEALQVSIIPAN
jgi:hypothetical protein